MKMIRSLAFWVLLLAALAPAGAMAAETRTFLNTEGFGPIESEGTKGPANNYPGIVNVSGVPGTVTNVTLTAIDFTSNKDLDMALVGPNGAQVMLLSDACSTGGAGHEFWTFDDAAPVFVNQFSCASGQHSSVRPTNYELELDNLAVKGGPAGPFTDSLSVFEGISPNGVWKLFMLDDTDGSVGFQMPAFALNLEVEPPPPPPPIVQTVTVPGPSTTSSSTAPSSTPGTTKLAKTGERAAKLGKCKTKKSAKQRAKCRAKAQKLPV
jgi:hypothetical protein